MSKGLSSVMLRKVTTEGDREAMVASYASSEMFRQRAVDYLQQKWGLIHNKQISSKSYELPAWPEFQADSNGALRMIEEVLHEVFNVKVKDNAIDTKPAKTEKIK